MRVIELTPGLTKEIKNKWVEALKSGTYIQGQYTLKFISETETQTRHCCLGVLGEVCNLEINPSGNGFKDAAGYLPLISILGDNVVDKLIHKNDSHMAINRDYSNVIPIIETLETID